MKRRDALFSDCLCLFVVCDVCVVCVVCIVLNCVNNCALCIVCVRCCLDALLQYVCLCAVSGWQTLSVFVMAIVSMISLSFISTVAFVICWSDDCWLFGALLEWFLFFLLLCVIGCILMAHTANLSDRWLYRDEWRTLVVCLLIIAAIYYPLSHCVLALEDRWIAFEWLLMGLLVVERYRALCRSTIVKSSLTIDNSNNHIELISESRALLK